MVRSILWGLGAVLSLAGAVLALPTMAIPSSLSGEPVGGDPLWGLVLAKPVAGIFLLVIGLFIMYRTRRRHDIGEEQGPLNLN